MKASLFFTFLASVQYVKSQCIPENGVTVFSSTHPKASGCYTFGGYDSMGYTQFGNSDAVIWPMEYNFGNGNVFRWEFAFENTLDDFIVCVTNSEPIGNPGQGGVEIISCNSGNSLPIELSFSCGCSLPETDPMCEFGIIKDNICCPFECGTCGGNGCGSRPGGGSSCCGGQIELARVSCDDGVAPCNIASDDNDPSCELGIISDNICCPSECGECGGPGCGSRPGGAEKCCGTPIMDSGLFCDYNFAPCIIHPSFQEDIPISNEPIPDPNCEFGISSTSFGTDICCSEECGICGGSQCGLLPGGPEKCCGTVISNSGISCDEYEAPCILSEPVVVGSDPTCEFGIIKDNICCSPECGECGGQGCGSRPGGGSDCCGGPIVSKGLSCEDNVAPCVIV